MLQMGALDWTLKYCGEICQSARIAKNWCSNICSRMCFCQSATLMRQPNNDADKTFETTHAVVPVLSFKKKEGFKNGLDGWPGDVKYSSCQSLAKQILKCRDWDEPVCTLNRRIKSSRHCQAVNAGLACFTSLCKHTHGKVMVSSFVSLHAQCSASRNWTGAEVCVPWWCWGMGATGAN